MEFPDRNTCTAVFSFIGWSLAEISLSMHVSQPQQSVSPHMHIPFLYLEYNNRLFHNTNDMVTPCFGIQFGRPTGHANPNPMHIQTCWNLPAHHAYKALQQAHSSPVFT